MTEETMTEVETSSPETDKKVEEAFATLYAMPLSELRILYQREFSVALKGKDKQRIAMRLAKKMVAKGDQVESKSNGSSAIAKPAKKQVVPQAAPGTGGVTPSEAIAILDKARSSFVKVDALKSEKAEALRGVREHMGTAKEKMTETLRDDGDADVRLEKLEATWSRLSKLEAKEAKVKKDFGDKIKDASAAFRDIMTNLRQPSLPFTSGQDDDDAE